MGKVIQITRGKLILLMLGIILTAFLGIKAGNFVMRLTANIQRLEDNILLKVGQGFPTYSFLGLDENGRNSLLLLRDKKSVLIFLTTDCPHCEHLISRLDSTFTNLPSEYQIAGISFEPLEKLKSYRLLKNLSIPLYNDLNGKFTGKYKIDAFPTVVGVDDKGKVGFVEVGSSTDKTTQDYFEQL